MSFGRHAHSSVLKRRSSHKGYWSWTRWYYRCCKSISKIRILFFIIVTYLICIGKVRQKKEMLPNEIGLKMNLKLFKSKNLYISVLYFTPPI